MVSFRATPFASSTIAQRYATGQTSVGRSHHSEAEASTWNGSRGRGRLSPETAGDEALQQLSVGRVARNAGGSNIGAFAEMEDEIFPFFVDELDISEVNMKTADLQEVHTVLSEPALNARTWRRRQPVAQECRRLRFPDARYDRAPTAR